MNWKPHLYIILISVLLTSCAQQNREALYDFQESLSAIQSIKKEGIVIVFPTNYLKKRALRKLAKSKPVLYKKIEELNDETSSQWEDWMNARQLYTFSDMHFIPDSLLKDYVQGTDIPMEIKDDTVLMLAKENLGDIYVIYKEYGGFEVRSNYKYLPNPFPNKGAAATASQLKDLLGVQPPEKSARRFFSELHKMFVEFEIQSSLSVK